MPARGGKGSETVNWLSNRMKTLFLWLTRCSHIENLNVVVWIFFFFIKQIKKVLVKSPEVQKITASWFEFKAIFSSNDNKLN